MGKKWYTTTSIYKRIEGGYYYKRTSMHRMIMGLESGDKREVDHINGDGLDNRKENLRICTKAQNAWNQGPRSGKKYRTGYKGITFDKSKNRWMALIQKNRKNYYIGSYQNPCEAALAYNKKATELFGEYAYLNKVSI